MGFIFGFSNTSMGTGGDCGGGYWRGTVPYPSIAESDVDGCSRPILPRRREQCECVTRSANSTNNNLEWDIAGTPLCNFGHNSDLGRGNRPWYALTSTDENAVYMAFWPSFAAHWRSRGLSPVLAFVSSAAYAVDTLDEGYFAHKRSLAPDFPIESLNSTQKFLQELRRHGEVVTLRPEVGAPFGHQAKVARIYTAASLPSKDLVTVLDIEYYLMVLDRTPAIHFSASLYMDYRFTLCSKMHFVVF